MTTGRRHSEPRAGETQMEYRVYRALVVDGDRTQRDATAEAMAGQQFVCDTASDGQEALDKFHKLRHDLVVTELRMPGMHGYALTLELLQDAHPPRIIVLTEVVEPSLVKDLYGRGVDDVVHKPADLAAFAANAAGMFQQLRWIEPRKVTPPRSRTTSGHSLVAEIEHNLATSAEPLPAQLNALFQAASSISDPPQGMVSYLERMGDGSDGDNDRRQASRASLLATVTAIPLSRTLEPCGEPFKAAARDASAGGVSLLHTRAVNAEHLALRWQSLASPGQQIDILMRVLRCKPMGPFYEVAGEFAPHASTGSGKILSQELEN
jgi:CheY-like chemotaxis protein